MTPDYIRRLPTPETDSLVEDLSTLTPLAEVLLEKACSLEQQRDAAVMALEDMQGAAWELRKIILAYEAWAANPYSAAKASELSVHICSGRDWLEKRDLKHLQGQSINETLAAIEQVKEGK